MTEPLSDWNNDWMAAQKRWLSSFAPALNAAEPATAASGGFPFPWMTGTWWNGALPAQSPAPTDFFARMMDQSRGFAAFATALNPPAGSSGNWQDALRSAFDFMQHGASFGANKVPGPFDAWEHALSSLSLFPGDYLQGLNTPAHGSGAMQQNLKQFLSAPGLGQMREHQERRQLLISVTLEYQQALQAFTAACAELPARSFELLQQRLSEMAQNGETVTTLKALYALWVDAAEAAYADFARSDRYVELHGHLSNSLMALKRQGRLLVDEVQGGLNMPTRKEIDSLHLNLLELKRRECRMHEELAALKRQLAKPVPTPVRPAPTVRKAAAHTAPTAAPPRKTKPTRIQARNSAKGARK